MNSTAEDLARWVIALQQGKLLRTKSALQTLWTAGNANIGSAPQWALGWVTKPRPRHSAVTATGGGRAAIFVYPEDALAVIVLTNLASSFPEEFVDELAGIYNPEISAAASERDLNDWAYRMLNGGGKPKEALEIFKLNVYLYPTSLNVYDSVAEAYAALGQRDLAIQNYKRSLELDPKNTNAVQQLKKLDPTFE